MSRRLSDLSPFRLLPTSASAKGFMLRLLGESVDDLSRTFFSHENVAKLGSDATVAGNGIVTIDFKDLKDILYNGLRLARRMNDQVLARAITGWTFRKDSRDILYNSIRFARCKDDQVLTVGAFREHSRGGAVFRWTFTKESRDILYYFGCFTQLMDDQVRAHAIKCGTVREDSNSNMFVVKPVLNLSECFDELRDAVYTICFPQHKKGIVLTKGITQGGDREDSRYIVYYFGFFPLLDDQVLAHVIKLGTFRDDSNSNKFAMVPVSVQTKSLKGLNLYFDAHIEEYDKPQAAVEMELINLHQDYLMRWR